MTDNLCAWCGTMLLAYRYVRRIGDTMEFCSNEHALKWDDKAHDFLKRRREWLDLLEEKKKRDAKRSLQKL